MKKFLTVLLALSVVFTYSFSAVGTAFADTELSETEYDQLVEQAAAQVEATVTTAYNEAVKVLSDHDADSITGIEAEYWKASASLYADKLSDIIDAREAEIKDLYTEDNASEVNTKTLDDIIDWFRTEKDTGEFWTDKNPTTDPVPEAVVNTIKDAIYADTDVQTAAAKAYAKGLAEDAVIALKGIDTSVYSNTVNETTGMSSVAMAEALINTAVTAIQKLDFTAAEDITAVDTLLTSLGAFKTATYDAVTGDVTAEAGGSGILENFVHATDSNFNLEKYAISTAAKYENTALVTKDDEESNANTLAAKRASYLAKVESNYAAYLVANNDADGRAEAEAYKAGVSEIINAAETLTDLTDIFDDENKIPVPTGNYASDKALIDELVVFANKYIADGYDADDINDIVAAAKVAAYKDAAEWTGLDDAKDDIKAAVAAQFDTSKIDEEVAKLELALEALLEDDTDNGYYALEAAEVTALYNTIISEIKACTSDEDIVKVKTKYGVATNTDWKNSAPKGLSDIATKDDVKTAIKKTLTGDTGWTANEDAIEAYAAYLNAGLASTSDGYRDFVSAGMLTSVNPSYTVDADWLADFYAEKGARTTAEAYAMISDAKAALEAVKTVGAVNAAAAAIEAQIAALPPATSITASDAAAVEAVKEAYDKFVEETGSDISATAKLTLTRALTAAGNATKLSLLQEINTYASKTVTANDKAALEDLLERVNAFNDKIGTGKLYDMAGFTGVQATSISTVQSKLADIRNAAKKAVEQAIAALPLTVTKDNVEQVNAAKKLYDEYVATYTDFYTAIGDVYYPATGLNQNAADDITNIAELKAALKAADKVNAEIEAAEKEAIIAAVESLKITASSTAAKGSITVKWKVKGDYDAADGMRVYKSTKKNSGYGAKPYFITKKGAMQYKNTKELKKGTRYYYKVRAYVEIDGVKYYSDWSNKAYRIAK